MNRNQWNKIKEFPNQWDKIMKVPIANQNFKNMELLILLFFFLGISLVINESFVASTPICQSFVGFMSSYLPGIEMMSRASEVPKIVAFEFSLAWAIMPVMSVILFYHILGVERYFIESSKGFFIGTYIGILVLIVLTGYGFHQGIILDSKRSIVHVLIQSKIGIGIIAWLLAFSLPQFLATWILMSFEILKNLVKRIQENER